VSLRFGVTSALELARQALLAGMTVGLVLTGAGLFPFLLALVPSSLVVLAATWPLAGREVPLRPSFHVRDWAALSRPAIVLSLSSGLATIYLFTTQILTSLSAGAVQTGLFAASLRVFAVVASIPSLMVAAALPLLARAARDDTDRLHFALQRIFEVALIAGVGVSVVLVTGAGPIIHVVAGHRYAGAVQPLRIEGAAALGTCLIPVWSAGLLALHRHTAMLLCNVIVVSLTVALTLSLAPTLGANGSALATVAGELTAAACLLVALTRANRRLLPDGARVVPRVALAAAPAFAVMLVHLPGLVQLALAAAVYTAIIVLSRALPREILELLPSRARRA
jgi:PST family polysaccharide transporter